MAGPRYARQFVHDLEAFADRRAEVVGPFRDIGLIEIVGTHSHREELAHELEHDVGIIVHPFHEHRLIAHRAPGISEHLAGAFRFRRAFPWMVEVRVDVDGMILSDHFGQLCSDALRKNAGHLRPQPDDLDMRDFPQALEDAFEQEIGEHERIAAGEDDIADLGILCDVFDPVLNVLHIDLGRIPHLSLARAKAAVHRALARRQEEDAVRVPVDDARHRAVGILGERIFAEVRHHRGSSHPECTGARSVSDNG
jgi:hypothetical protein